MARWLIAALTVLALAGCSGQSSEVEAVVKEFAAAAGDPERTCRLITEADRAQLEKLASLTGGRTCADAVGLGDAKAGDVNLEDVEVKGDRATVEETLTATTFTLRREDGEWRVDLLALDQLGWTLRQSLACSQFTADAEALGEPGDDRRELASYMRRYEGLVEDWAAAAERVKPSRMYTKRHRDLIAGIDEFRQATRRLRAAVSAGRGIDPAYRDFERAERGLRGFPITCGPQA